MGEVKDKLDVDGDKLTLFSVEKRVSLSHWSRHGRGGACLHLRLAVERN